MPLFEYQCKKCGKKFEELVVSSGKNETINCPYCGSTRTEKLLSTFVSSSSGYPKSSGGSGCAPSSGGG